MIFTEGEIYFNKIIILQSLNDNDRKTGTELHDDTISRRAWVNSNLETELIDIENKLQFISLLNDIQQASLSNNLIPFIHLEMHGFNEGISLRSGECIFWSEILPTLSAINQASKNNLFISVASCYGGNIQFIVKIKEPCPFRGFIGPIDKIGETDLLISFTNFFDTLLTTNDFDKAIKALNLSNSSGVTFHHLNSEAFFDLAIKNLSHRQSREQRIDDISFIHWEYNPNCRLKFISFNDFRAYVESHHDEIIPQTIQKMRKRFLHLDIA